MLIKSYKLSLCRIIPLICSSCRKDSGHVKEMGGKWAELQAAQEDQYFYKKNKEYLEYIREEIKKGRSVEDIINETKEKLEELERCRLSRRKGNIDDDDCSSV